MQWQIRFLCLRKLPALHRFVVGACRIRCGDKVFERERSQQPDGTKHEQRSHNSRNLQNGAHGAS